MDWASSQWKEGLPSIAVQKVNALEEKIEKFTKERQQKQLQFECLELTLGKEKRKVEEEKQQTVRLERELQNIADSYKNLENKQQKLQAEIQNRDSRLTNLEGQLAQAKKQNSRLQQLENDIEDLRCLRDNSKLENKELEEQLKKEQSTVVKQSDAISDLEKTIRTLQEKCSNEKSLTINTANKENIDIFNENRDSSPITDSLRAKILDQENTIKSLKAQLLNISENKEKLSIPTNDSFQTPSKMKNVLTEKPVSSAKKSYSFWDNFGSTPAKETKTKHDSSTFDYESDEKARTLQQKLKQMSQELECQRHNSEASKNAMEQRLKEKENSLKTEVKQHAQTIYDLDRELKELKNKYQQDVVQSTKKLDVVNTQLQKSEFSKQQMEKDLKALELQINSNNLLLQQKEDELKDLHKQKNSIESTTKVLQSKNRELERNCSVLQQDKKSLNEDNRDLKMQLDGSNNLVKEKETVINNMKKQQDSASKINSELQIKIQAINKDLSVVQSEKQALVKQLKDLDTDLLMLRENVKNLNAEKKNICDLLDIEKCKTGKLENESSKHKTEILSLQSEIKSHEQNVNSLSSELEQLKNNSIVKVKNVEQELFRCKEENSHLANQIQTNLEKEKSLLENLDQLKKENERNSGLLSNKTNETETLGCKIKTLESQLSSLHRDNESKSENISTLKQELASAKESHQNKVQELDHSISKISEENTSLKNQLNDITAKELSMQENLVKLDSENKKILDVLTSTANEKQTAESNVKELKSKLVALQSDSDAKAEENTLLQKDIAVVKETSNNKVQELEHSISKISEENTSLQNQLNDITAKELSLKENLVKLENENQKILGVLTATTNEKQTAESKIEEMKSKLVALQSESDAKTQEITLLKKDIAGVKETSNIKVLELEKLQKSISKMSEENTSLKNQLNDITTKGLLMQENLVKLDNENKKILDVLNSTTNEKQTAEFKVEEMKSKFVELQSESDAKAQEITVLKKDIAGVKETSNVKVSELQKSLDSSSVENTQLKNQLNELAEKEKTVNKTIEQLLEESNNISAKLTIKIEETQSLKSDLEHSKSQLLEIQLDCKSKQETIANMKKNSETVEKEYICKIQDLQNSLSSVQAEKDALDSQVQKLSSEDILLQEKIKQMELENVKLINSLDAEIKKVQLLETTVDELKTNLQNLQSDLNVQKESSISMEKDSVRRKELYEVKIGELNNNLSMYKSEKESFKNQLDDCVAREESLQKSILQAEAKKQSAEDQFIAEKTKSEALALDLAETKKKLDDVLEQLETKDTTINNLSKNNENLKISHENTLSELQESIAAVEAEKSSVERQLNELTASEESLRKDLLQIETEKQNISAMLVAEQHNVKTLESDLIAIKKNSENLQTDLDSNFDNVQKLKKEIEDLKSFYEAQIKDVHDEHDNCSQKEVALNEKINHLQTENIQMNDSLSCEKRKIEIFETTIKDLNAKVENLECELRVSNETFNSFSNNIESCKESYEIKLKELEDTVSAIKLDNENLSNQVKDYVSNENVLKQTLEIQKKTMSDLLLLESEKSKSLESNIEELNSNILSLQTEAQSKDENICGLKAEIGAMKENFETKILELLEQKKAAELEVLPLQQQLEEYATKETIFKKNLEEIELKNQSITCLMSSELELKTNVEVLLTKLKSKDECISSLESEIETLKNALEEKGTYFATYISSIQSNVISIQECIKGVNADSEHIGNEVLALKNESEKLQVKDIDDQKMRLEFLYDLLNQMNSVEKLADTMSQIYEEKVTEQKHLNELARSEVSMLHLKLEEYAIREICLKKNVEEMEAKDRHICDLMASEEDLKSRISNLLVTLSSKDEHINYLESEVEASRNAHEDVKSGLLVYIQNIGSSVIPMQESIKDVYMKNELICEEMETLKDECKEINIQEVQNRENFLYDILNQLHSIEKCATVVSKDYEDSIESLERKLCDVNDEKSEISFRYDTLLATKSTLEDCLLESQDKIKTLEQGLREVGVLHDYVEKLYQEIEMSHVQKLEMTRIHEQQLTELKMQHQESIDALKRDFCDVNNEKSEICLRYDALLAAKSTLEDSLLESQDKIKNLEQSLRDVGVLDNVVQKLSQEIEMSQVQKLEMARIHEQQLTGLKLQYQEKISEQEHLYEQARSEVSILHLKLEEYASREMCLKKDVEEVGAKDQHICDLMASEEDLKSRISNLLVTLSSKDEHINYLESEVEASRNAHEEVKSGLLVYIQNIGSSVIPMQESIKDVYMKNELICEEMETLKDECKEINIQEVQDRKNFLYDILNQLHSIEKCATAISKEYEESIDALKGELCDVKNKKSEICLRHDALLAAKSTLENCLLESQDEIKNLKQNLRNADALDGVVQKLSDEIETLQVEKLEIVRIYEQQLTELKLQHQAEMSSLSHELEVSLDNYNSIESTLQSIVLKSKIICLQEQNTKVSDDLIHLKHDHGYDKRDLKIEGKKIKDMCHLVLDRLDILENYLKQHNVVEIPLEVTEVVNDCFQSTSTKISSSSMAQDCCDSVHQNLNDMKIARKLGLELDIFSKAVLDKLCSLEGNILSQKEYFNFLATHKLIEDNDHKKILNSLKFLRKVYNETCHKKSTLKPLRKPEDYRIFSQNQFCEELRAINLLSDNSSENGDVSLFFEKCLLINSYRNMYMISKLKKTLRSVTEQLNIRSIGIAEHMKKFYKYQNVHSHHSHLAVNVSSNYIIFMHNMSSLYCMKETSSEICASKFPEHVFCMEDILCNLSIAKVPFIVNCAYVLTRSSRFSDNFNYSAYKNLVCFVLKTLASFYKGNISFLSPETVKYFEEFISLVSKTDASELKDYHFKNQCKALGDIVIGLFHDLSFANSASESQHSVDANNRLLEVTNQVIKLKLECENKQRELSDLHASLSIKKEQQQNLAVHCQGIESNLTAAIMKKEELKQRVIEVSKICSVLRNIFSDSCDIEKLQSETANLSVTFCLCHNCLNKDGESSDDREENHILFSPMNLVNSVAELYTSKNDYEKEVIYFKKKDCRLKEEIKELENEKSVLTQTVHDLEKNINLSNHNLDDLKSQYASLEKEYQNINSLLSESNAVQKNQLNSIEIHMKEIRKCKDEYQELFCENQKIKSDTAMKDKEISRFEMTIEEKISESEVLILRSKEYETELKHLNNTITELMADLTETKSKLNDEEAKANINELHNKIASLEKANKLLNITVENVEEELQNLYMEKQKIEEKLEEKQKEIENLQKESVSWKCRTIEDEGKVSSLQSTVKDLEKSLQDTDQRYTELLKKNSELQKDIALSNRTQKQHQMSLLEKNFCIKQKDLTITQLKEKISIKYDENNSLEMNIAEVKSKLNSELEDKGKLLHDLEKKLDSALREKLDLEKQISEFSSTENERFKVLKDRAEEKLKCEELEFENSSLKIEIEKLIDEKASLDSHLRKLNQQIATAEKDVEKASQLQVDFNSKKEKYSESIDALQEEVKLKEKSIFENCSSIEKLQQEVKELKKANTENAQYAKKKIDELLSQKNTLETEVNSLMVQSNHVCECKNDFSISDLQQLKSTNDYKPFSAKIINLLTDIVKSVDCNSDNDRMKSDLLYQLTCWNHDCKDSTNLIIEVHEKLQSFLKTQQNRQKEMEFKLCSVTKSICNSLIHIGQYCESFDQNSKLNFDLTTIMDKSCLDASLHMSEETVSDYSLNSLAEELRKSLKMLELCFSSVKTAISKKEMEIESLKANIDESTSKLEISSQSEKQPADVQTLKNRLALLTSNGRRFEKKHNKLLQTCEAMEKHIKKLETEKIELEAEASELSEKLKQHSASDELMETCKLLSKRTKELRQLKEDNAYLKSTVDQFQVLFNEHSINMSSACET